MAIREGAWDCPVCGRKGNRGPDKFCGGCGAPRGPEVQFYLPDDAPEVTEAAALKRAQAGPDWSCAYCGADNPSTNAFCSSCGAPRDPDAGTRQVVEHPLGAPPPQPLATPPPQTPTTSRFKRGCQLGCLGLVLLAGLFVYLGRPREKALTVTGFHWARTIAVEELRPVVEQAWEGEVPNTARVLGRSREVHHVDHLQIGTQTRSRTVHERVQTGTERVKTGSRDLGNGYFEDVYEDRPVYEDRSHEETYQEPVYHDRPVYRQRYRYEIQKWLPDREAKAEGTGRNPAWPDPRLGVKEREGARTELYEVLFRDADDNPAHYKAPNEQAWRTFEEGRAYKGKVKRDGEVTEIQNGGR
jgi:Zn-finger in Ran binding protein and others